MYLLYSTDSFYTSHKDVHVYSAYLAVLNPDYLKSVFGKMIYTELSEAVDCCTYTSYLNNTYIHTVNNEAKYNLAGHLSIQELYPALTLW